MDINTLVISAVTNLYLGNLVSINIVVIIYLGRKRRKNNFVRKDFS